MSTYMYLFFLFLALSIFLPCCTDKALKSAILFKSDKDENLFFILQTNEEMNRIPVRVKDNATSSKLSAQGIIFIYIFNKTKGYNNT